VRTRPEGKPRLDGIWIRGVPRFIRRVLAFRLVSTVVQHVAECHFVPLVVQEGKRRAPRGWALAQSGPRGGIAGGDGSPPLRLALVSAAFIDVVFVQDDVPSLVRVAGDPWVGADGRGSGRQVADCIVGVCGGEADGLGGGVVPRAEAPCQDAGDGDDADAGYAR